MFTSEAVHTIAIAGGLIIGPSSTGVWSVLSGLEGGGGRTILANITPVECYLPPPLLHANSLLFYMLILSCLAVEALRAALSHELESTCLSNYLNTMPAHSIGYSE